MRRRLGEPETWRARVVQTLVMGCALAATPFPVCRGLAAHLFGLELNWGATPKSLDSAPRLHVLRPRARSFGTS